MDSEYDTSQPEIRAQIQLLKSHIERKALLNYEISQMIISTSYRKSTGRRDLIDLSHQGKLLSRRLSAVRYISETLKQTDLRQMSKEVLSDLVKFTQEAEPKLEISRDVFSLNFELDTLVQELKDYYSDLSQNYQTKMSLCNENQAKIEETDEKVLKLERLERETKDYASEIQQFEKEIQEMNAKKERVKSRKRGSVDKVKIFQQLSANAMQLRSKLLLKEELVRNLKSAEQELDELNERVQKKQTQLEEIDLAREENRKNTARFEVDLHDLRKDIKRLEIRMQGLSQEKTRILKQESLAQDSVNEGETVCFPSILSGFKQIHKENTFLYEENLKLKERLSRLFKEMKKGTLRGNFEWVEKKRMGLPAIQTITPTNYKCFAPLRPLTEVRERKSLMQRLSFGESKDLDMKLLPVSINIKQITLPINRVTQTFRNTMIRCKKATNTTQTESPDKENLEN